MPGETNGADGRELPETLLTENLKSIRLLHQILMVVSVTILAFALRPDPSDDLRAALNELSTLQQVAWDSWGNFIANRYKAYADKNDMLAKEVVNRAGFAIQGQLTLAQPVLGDQPPNVVLVRLIDLDSFREGPRRIGALKLDVEGQGEGVGQLKRATAARKDPLIAIGMFLTMGGETPLANGVRMLDWRNPPPVPQATLNVFLRGEPVAINSAIPCTTFSETGPFAREWVLDEAFGRKLVDSKTGILLPHLKLFWDRVGTQSVGQASVFLQEEVASDARGTISFFGIPVERSLAVSAGPAVCFSILFFLCLHVRHFRLFVGKNDQIKYFPWPPLFRGPLSLAGTYATVAVLPILANEELLRRYGHGREWSTWVGIAFATVMLAASVWAVGEIRKLRAQFL